MGQQHSPVMTHDTTRTWGGNLDNPVTSGDYLYMLRALDNLQFGLTINDKIQVTGTVYESVDVDWHGYASQARYNLQILLQTFNPKTDIKNRLTKNHITDLAQMFDPRAPNMSYIVTHTPNHLAFNIPSQNNLGEEIDDGLFGGPGSRKVVVGQDGMWLPSIAILQRAKDFFGKLIEAHILVDRDPNHPRQYVSVDQFPSQLNHLRIELENYDAANLVDCVNDNRKQTSDVMVNYTALVVEHIPLLKNITRRTGNINTSLYLQCHPHVVRAFDPVHLIASILARKDESMKMFMDMPQDNWSRVLASCKVAAAHTHLINCVRDKKIPPNKTTTS
jgi:hypothetical protein